MSTNVVNKETGELITLASGIRVWCGSKTAHDLAVQQGTMPNNCMVCITDDAAGEEAWQYSTSETRTGKTWIDGKPIYRRVFYSATNWSTSTVVGTISNLDMVVEIRDICSADGAYMQNYGADAAGTTQRATVNRTTGAVTVYRGLSFVNSNPSAVIVEYTKTTS